MTAWLVRPRVVPTPQSRVFCLPYAGGSASAYRLWSRFAPLDIEVCSVELPGRGTRFGEQAYVRMDDLVGDLARSMQPFLDRPYTVFGHSMGGLVEFELTRRLRTLGAQAPEHLIVSAASDPSSRQAPQSPLHLASDALVMAKLRSLNGTPAVLLDNDEFMRLMMPTIRADFAVLETYRYRAQEPLAVPITVLGGTQDTTVCCTGLAGWSQLCTRGFGLQMFDGDHFFLHDFGPELVSLVTKSLSGAIRR